MFFVFFRNKPKTRKGYYKNIFQINLNIFFSIRILKFPNFFFKLKKKIQIYKVFHSKFTEIKKLKKLLKSSKIKKKLFQK